MTFYAQTKTRNHARHFLYKSKWQTSKSELDQSCQPQNLRRASQVFANGTDYIRESNSNYINFTTVEILIADSCEDQTILCWAVLLEPNCQLARRNFARHTRRHPSAKPFDLIRDDLSLLPRIPTELRVCQAYQNVSSTNSALRATYGCVT